MVVHRTHICVLFLISLFTCIFINNTSLSVIAKEVAKSRIDVSATQHISDYTSKQENLSIRIWEDQLKNSRTSEETANLHNNLAYAYNQRGETSKAIDHLKQAAIIYQKSGNEAKLVAILVDLAQAHNSLGQFARAMPILEQAISLASEKGDKKALAVAWGVRGNSYFIVKKYDEALDAYRKSFGFAEGLDTNYTITALNNQVNTYIVRGDWYASQAIVVEAEGDTQEQERLIELETQDRVDANIVAKQALEISLNSNNLSEVRALLNMLRLTPKDQYQQRAESILVALPDSRNKAYSFIKLATYQAKEAKIDSLKQAISISANLNDFRTSSFALGELGHFYEQEGRFQEALTYTRSAILAAQTVTANDSLYRWQWQLGRINNLAGAKNSAIDSYRQAITSLQSIRSDIVSASTDLQFDVRDEVEPVYRQFIGLLLDSGDPKSVSEALETTQLLKLTELQNFFGDECTEVSVNSSQQDSQLSDNRAIVTTIILDHKTYVILQANNQVIKCFSVSVSSMELQNKVKNFRFDLEDIRTKKYFTLAQEFYNLLIKPMSIDLDRLNPSKLTFINDGILRNIPMSALHDGKQFLIEKYPIDTTLGVELKLPQTSQTTRKALIFGLTVEVSPFDPLPNVYSETESILNLVGGSRYLDKNFTLSNLQNKVQKNNYPIIHIASHSVFSGTAGRTFLQAYDRQISLKEFEEIMRKRKNSIELLTLSSCETAVGDNRSTLGLAGVAVRNKVENVLASLWSLNDGDTVLPIEEFYRQLKQPNITKAKALRNAQIALIAGSHPAIWSGLVLVSS